MIRDPIVEEVHEIREKIFRECDGDWHKVAERWKALGEEYKDRLVSVEEFREKHGRGAKPDGGGGPPTAPALDQDPAGPARSSFPTS